MDPLPTQPAPRSSAALAWAVGRLAEPLASATRLDTSPRSQVVRLRAESGATYYLKSDPLLPPSEAVVLARLQRLAPDRVAPVAALDETRGWTLTRDVGDVGLDGAGTEVWCRIAESFAALQIATFVDVPGFLEAGCRDLRGDRLHGAIEAMLADCTPELSADERRGVDLLRPRIASACAALGSDGIPATLVHQDLVPENIALPCGAPVFLDWSDTVVGHPFFGFDRLLDSCWTDRDRKEAVIAAYLATFAGRASPTELRTSFDHVLSLRVLYEDVRWHHEVAAFRAQANAGPLSVEHAARLERDMLAGVRMVAAAAAR